MGGGRRIIELDGLRGLAALMVLVSHFFGEVAHGGRLASFGWLGVEIFFVLSGFLIGTIILEQRDRPGFIADFYRRRAARILPVYVLVCAVTLLLAAATAGHSWSDTPYRPPVYAGFAANIMMSLQGGGGIWLRPTWTLDVEEQFYLLLPLAVLLCPRRLLPWLVGALFVSATLVRAALAPAHPEAALSLLPARMDLLLAGVGIALLNRGLDLKRHLLLLRLTPLAAAVSLLLVCVLSPFTLFLVLGSAIAAIGIAGFLLAVLHGAPEGARFRHPVLRYFGRISFCLYLVHQPVAGLLHGLLRNAVPDIGTPAALAVTLLAVGVSVAIADMSWRWLEAPILAWARRGRAPAGAQPQPAF